MPISNVDPTSFANYTIKQLLDIPYEEYSTITSAQISALSNDKMHAIHIDWLSDSALSGLTAQNITGITDLRYFIDWIKPAQIALINPDSYAALTVDQLLSISYEKYSAITAAQISALSKEKMHAIHIDWLSDSALAGLTAQNITGIVDLKYFSEWIRPEQMARISASAIHALTSEQLIAWSSRPLPTVDTTKPKSLTLMPAAGPAPEGEVNVSQYKAKVDGIENNANWYYSVDSSGWKLGGQDQSIALKDGTHYYWLTQIDAAGNESVTEGYVAEWNASANKLLQLLSLTAVFESLPIINLGDVSGGGMGGVGVLSAAGTNLLSPQWVPTAY